MTLLGSALAAALIIAGGFMGWRCDDASPLLFRRLRVILDCTLISLVVLIVGANLLPVQAKPGAQD
jgi:uncharacterized membrane protein